MFDKFLCCIGWHTWVWSVLEHGWGENGAPPSGAKCKRCGIKYGRKK